MPLRGGVDESLETSSDRGLSQANGRYNSINNGDQNKKRSEKYKNNNKNNENSDKNKKDKNNALIINSGSSNLGIFKVTDLDSGKYKMLEMNKGDFKKVGDFNLEFNSCSYDKNDKANAAVQVKNNNKVYKGKLNSDKKINTKGYSIKLIGCKN
ncbi:MAG: hypothetical protein OIF36_00830 [Alphaproteobacteria bacterium]|nr:hypothetical protein [Alphaproteobacteria bacterium]